MKAIYSYSEPHLPTEKNNTINNLKRKTIINIFNEINSIRKINPIGNIDLAFEKNGYSPKPFQYTFIEKGSKEKYIISFENYNKKAVININRSACGLYRTTIKLID